ncbi:MAG: prepilin-type N-terminal cleavage/methylation domain-containing protein [Desulfobacteraceae bacterium]|nr:prepilin-type N-terminal cleavage/methylation domain-containing protein [Desulfobacteraceae bacterium]
MAIEKIKYKNNSGGRQLSIFRSNKGFSLIELVIAVVVLSIVIALIINSKNEQTDNYMSQNQLVEMQQALRGSMIIMTQEIRKIGFDPHVNTAGVGFIYGAGTTGSTLTFAYVADADTKDNDNDGFSDELGELKQVFIWVNGASQLRLDEPLKPLNNQTIAENVQSVAFTYLDNVGANVGAPAAAGSPVRSIQIDLTLSPDAKYIHESGNNRTLSTVVKCRNIQFL